MPEDYETLIGVINQLEQEFLAVVGGDDLQFVPPASVMVLLDDELQQMMMDSSPPEEMFEFLGEQRDYLISLMETDVETRETIHDIFSTDAIAILGDEDSFGAADDAASDIGLQSGPPCPTENAMQMDLSCNGTVNPQGNSLSTSLVTEVNKNVVSPPSGGLTR